jgi:flavorubredoxin
MSILDPVAPAVEPLPREIAPGVFWLGRCTRIAFQGQPLHQYASVYLVVGDRESAIVEAGFAQDTRVILEQLENLLRAGVPEPRHILVTHTETPHAGGVGDFLSRFPAARARGGVSDLHLAFPHLADRVQPMAPGDVIDLGGTQLSAVPAVFRDMADSIWFFDSRRRVLFAGDGFAYCHYHAEGHCGLLAEEAAELSLADEVSLFATAAFYWTQFVDIEPYIESLRHLIFEQLEARMIAPTHGLPIGEPALIMPAVERGLRLGSALNEDGTIIG